MTLKTRITDDMKAAMRNKDSVRLGAIRLITAAIKQKEVDERIEADDSHVQAIIEKMIKQRKDSISQFQSGGRQDLADIEQAELTILAEYQAEQLPLSEIDAVIATALATTGARGVQDMGKVMGAARPQLAGKADMALVSTRIKAALEALAR